MVQRRSPFTESLLTPIKIWILIPITIWNTNYRWWELSFFEPRRSSRTTRTRKLNWNILNQSFRTTATNRGCLASRQRQPTPQVQKAKSSPLVLTVSHFPTCKGFSENWLTNVFKKQGVGTSHKPFKTIRQHLVHPKDPTHKERKCGVVYEIECEGCDDFLARPFGVWGSRNTLQ